MAAALEPLHSFPHTTHRMFEAAHTTAGERHDD